MPQNQTLRNQEVCVQSTTRADLRPINPANIKISDGVIPDTKEVEKIVGILKNKGSLPEIIITPSNELISGINALEAAKEVGQALILASVQRSKSQSEKLQIIADIKLDGGTQSRAAINGETLAEYTHAWREGAIFPPVICFYDGENYWLADGFHRCLSARQAGLTEINADIRQGTRRDAVLFSVGANANHGLRRTNEDKRRAVTTLLQDDEWAQWSDREIARRTGVHHDTVGRLRAELSGGIRQIDERKVERSGTTYTQKAKVNKPWTPKETDRVEITEGEHKGKTAEVRVITGNTAMCFVEGCGTKHQHIYIAHMKPIQKESAEATSVRQETKQQQQEFGLGKREQVLPDVERNEGFNPAEVSQQQPATVVNLNAREDLLVSEVAIALIRLTPEQLHSAIIKAFPGWDKAHIEAAYQALHEYGRKVA
ncbi:hypothetical protein LC593_10950 [Nostoc sp. CHAB 5844]|nr:hypothetical protein [Nostoc sp. CHAB 5844]